MFPSETNGLSGMAIPLRLIEQLYAFFKEFPSVLALNTTMKLKSKVKLWSDIGRTNSVTSGIKAAEKAFDLS